MVVIQSQQRNPGMTENPVPQRYGKMPDRPTLERAALAHGRPDMRAGRSPVIFRQIIGEVLRDTRTLQGRTLREVSSAARVSLGYLSEVERGQKEASSELLASICDALDSPQSSVFGQVAERMALLEEFDLPTYFDMRPKVPAAS